MSSVSLSVCLCMYFVCLVRRLLFCCCVVCLCLCRDCDGVHSV